MGRNFSVVRAVLGRVHSFTFSKFSIKITERIKSDFPTYLADVFLAVNKELAGYTHSIFIKKMKKMSYWYFS